MNIDGTEFCRKSLTLFDCYIIHEISDLNFNSENYVYVCLLLLVLNLFINIFTKERKYVYDATSLELVLSEVSFHWAYSETGHLTNFLIVTLFIHEISDLNFNNENYV